MLIYIHVGIYDWFIKALVEDGNGGGCPEAGMVIYYTETKLHVLRIRMGWCCF
jgi:hypothetical protein